MTLAPLSVITMMASMGSATDRMGDVDPAPARGSSMPDTFPNSGSGLAWSKARLPAEPGPAREQAILRAIRNGGARLRWTTIESTWLGHRARIAVTADALGIGPNHDFVRVNMNYRTAHEIADYIGASLLTPHVATLAWQQAAYPLKPSASGSEPLVHPDPFVEPFGSGSQVRSHMGSTLRMVLHDRQIRHKLRAVHGGEEAGNRLIGNVGKHWVITNRFLEPGTNREGIPYSQCAANFGWWDGDAPNGIMWQGQIPGLQHNLEHVDYSQTLSLMGAILQVDGVDRHVWDVMRDPRLCGLVSNEGVMRIVRHPKVGPPPNGFPLPPSGVPPLPPGLTSRAAA